MSRELVLGSNLDSLMNYYDILSYRYFVHVSYDLFFVIIFCMNHNFDNKRNFDELIFQISEHDTTGLLIKSLKLFLNFNVIE